MRRLFITTALILGLLGQSAASQALRYVALITQNYNQEPTVTVLENDIGDIQWHRFVAGDYRGTLQGAFPQGRTVTYIGTKSALASGFYSLNRISNDDLWLTTSTLTHSQTDPFELVLELTDTMLFETPITITVYPKKKGQ